jgi:outer membrane protein OmpA-like peptidoglycan-associated protein
MSKARNTTALAVVLAASVGAGAPVLAQGDEAVNALVGCVLEDVPCPEAPTGVQVDEALEILRDRTGEPPGQLRQRLQDRLAAAGAPEPADAEGVEVEAAEQPEEGAGDTAEDTAAEGDEAAAPAAEVEAAEGAIDAVPEDAATAVQQSDESVEEGAETLEEGAEPALDGATEMVEDAEAEAGQAAEAAGEGIEDTEAALEDALREAEQAAGAEETVEDGAADEPAADAISVGSQEDASAESEPEADVAADADAPVETDPAEAAVTDAADVAAETGADAARDADTAETPPMPGPDATPQEIAEALSDMPDGEARDELLERLQEGLADEAAVAAPATEAEAPDEGEQQRRQEMAEEAAEAARASAALAAIEEAAESAAAVETETEVVTEETARTSAEDVTVATEEADDEDRFETLRNILGGAAAGFVIGQLLDSGDEVVAQTGDRVIVNRDGEYVVLSDENALLRRPGTEVESQTFEDGSTRTVFRREDGTSVVTIRAPDGRVLYRSRIEPDGERVVLIDEREAVQPVRVERLPDPRRTPVIEYEEAASAGALARALREVETVDQLDRTFSLQQVLEIRELRELMPRVDLEAITFPTGSAAIQPSQAQELAALGTAMSELIDENPDELFLVEGHTDTVGGEITNLALSDRRAESVALALTEYFGIPPENMVTQGYGERYLKYPIEGDVRENRRAAVRRITPLIRTAQR